MTIPLTIKPDETFTPIIRRGLVPLRVNIKRFTQQPKTKTDKSK